MGTKCLAIRTWGSRRRCKRVECQPACKPGSVRKVQKASRDDHSSGMRVACAPRCDQPGRRSGKPDPGLSALAAPIRSCSRWGLPCRPCCQVRGALLPHPFTLAPGGPGAVCFLWHFPWGHPRRALPGTVSPWSPDFPPPQAPFGTWRRRPSGRLAFDPPYMGSFYGWVHRALPTGFRAGAQPQAQAPPPGGPA
jgi:hypothetical protein